MQAIRPLSILRHGACCSAGCALVAQWLNNQPTILRSRVRSPSERERGRERGREREGERGREREREREGEREGERGRE